MVAGQVRRGREDYARVRSLARPCPRCGQPARLTDDNPARPFCCDRCKRVDLGEWLLESMRIPGKDGATDSAMGEETGSF